jgi:nuclear transport factor 2 (NTF2) superfamily protein
MDVAGMIGAFCQLQKDSQFDWTLAQRPDDHPSLSDLVV